MVRESFVQRPVHGSGTGCQAQRAVLHGGTLDNGKVGVEWTTSHGFTVKGLINRFLLEPSETITLYGGEEQRRPPHETAEHTHMRVIPETSGQRVLNGAPFAATFPRSPPQVSGPGFDTRVLPQCDRELADLIRRTGLGYMANSPITYCPLGTERANVTVARVPMYRRVAGVGYTVLLVLTCGNKQLQPGTPLLCDYRPKMDLPAKFQFRCRDPSHYHAAGQPFPRTEESSDGDDTGV